MDNAVLVGLSRQMALGREMDVVANNIANLNTTGFKADGSIFEEYLFRRAARAASSGSRASFVLDRGVWHDMSQGSIERTGNSLDVAIDGKGFMVVQTPNGERYSRNGSLQISPTGQLVTSDGYPVLGDGGPITLQSTDQASLDQPRRHHQRARRQHRKSIRRAASSGWSPSPVRSSCRKTAPARSARQPHAAATGDDRRLHPGRDREIQRTRRRRDVAHDRDHPQLHPYRGHVATADRSQPIVDR